MCSSDLIIKKAELTIGTFLTFNSILIFFLSPIKNLLNLDYTILEAKRVIKRANEMLLDDYKDSPIKTCDGNIKISNLCFELNDKMILNNININISKGEKVIITGKSGSGKSTLLKILMKYYTKYSGEIKINNNNLNDINNNIIYISQNELLFTDTIFNNIVYDNDEGFNLISKACHLDEITKNNLGYNTLIEENGFNISGGQKQRIVLARALLRNFDILLIDEGLNQVDISLERKILKEIFNLYKEKTIIIVSHRLENMDLYDRKIILEKGKIKDNYKKNGKF